MSTVWVLVAVSAVLSSIPMVRAQANWLDYVTPGFIFYANLSALLGAYVVTLTLIRAAQTCFLSNVLTRWPIRSPERERAALLRCRPLFVHEHSLGRLRDLERASSHLQPGHADRSGSHCVRVVRLDAIDDRPAASIAVPVCDRDPRH